MSNLYHVDKKGVKRKIDRILGRMFIEQDAIIKGRLKRDDVHYKEFIPVLCCAHDDRHDPHTTHTFTATLNNYIIE